MKKKETLLSDLTLAILKKPNANLYELAHELNISKATLYRFCGTKENLESMVIQYTMTTINDILTSIELNPKQPLASLNQLMSACMEKDAAIGMMMSKWHDQIEVIQQTEQLWNQALDQFFLEGQKNGCFCVDINAAALTEAWIALLVGLIDAKQRGRVASTELIQIQEQVFFKGVMIAQTA